MTAIATPANFNGARPIIDPNDAVMLLIDHQSGLFQTVNDMPMPKLRAHAAALARMATLSKMPVITTASVPQGPNGPMIPEIHANAPHAKYVARKGEINAWDNPDFVAAVARLTDEADLVKLTDRFGVRRTDRRFWPLSDALHAEWRRTAPREAAILDYSRLDNR